MEKKDDQKLSRYIIIRSYQILGPIINLKLENDLRKKMSKTEDNFFPLEKLQSR